MCLGIACPRLRSLIKLMHQDRSDLYKEDRGQVSGSHAGSNKAKVDATEQSLCQPRVMVLLLLLKLRAAVNNSVGSSTFRWHVCIKMMKTGSFGSTVRVCVGCNELLHQC